MGVGGYIQQKNSKSTSNKGGGGGNVQMHRRSTKVQRGPQWWTPKVLVRLCGRIDLPDPSRLMIAQSEMKEILTALDPRADLLLVILVLFATGEVSHPDARALPGNSAVAMVRQHALCW